MRDSDAAMVNSQVGGVVELIKNEIATSPELAIDFGQPNFTCASSIQIFNWP
ncbi:hypothetical protein [Rhizobium sp. RHZ01]|uniref:hypothetical protein n=1 Tax=Rhizobium sp. RHZ01 TaxID=2769304 RepID=UPI00177E7C20|nr:hypothetical protein [Rhizobium sp. RHZ01]MBD9449816.1 hypothetical protein [Rhizobium sp. RHZ01]